MHTEILAVDASSIARAAAVLHDGGLVAFPTETVYGLGANALNAAAVARIFDAKGRPANNPLIVHVACQKQVAQIAAEWPPLADLLAARFWPGPLTLVLPKRDEVPAIVTAGGPTIAVRIPAHAVALALLRAANVPIAAPSANRANQLSPTSAAHVLRWLEGRIDLILDGGSTPGGIESTVVDLTTQPPRLLRPGLLQASDLEAICGALQHADKNFSEKALPSPGLSPRHYAPRTPTLAVEDNGLKLTQVLLEKSLRVGWLKFTRDGTPTPAGVVVRTLPAEPTAAAAQLYAVLHELDDANVDRILVFLPPDTASWSAIRDRLRRASS